VTTALAKHFFQGFFRLSFLDDAGEESFRRVIFGLLAGFIAVGLWLPRLFSRKYFYLSAHGDAAAYAQALLADQLLMLCLPMFIVAFAMALVCHSLFPDETDYRILMPLPISRAVIFAAKLLALAAFASIFIVSTTLSIAIPFAAVSTGCLNPHYWPVRALALVGGGILASIFAACGIVGVQGVVSVATPRRALRSVSVVLQTSMVTSLVLLLPIIARIPANAARLHATPWWLSLVPPAWFLGFEEVLLGSRDPQFLHLATIAIFGTAAVALIAIGCYLVVYRRFDRLILRTEPRRQGEADFLTRSAEMAPSTFSVRPEYTAVSAFTTATLRRSGLHQLVVFGVSAGGAAMAVNGVLSASTHIHRESVQAALTAPLMLMFAGVLGLRTALLLPATRRAVWIFRLTEEDTRRPHQLAVVEHLLLAWGALIPSLVALPFEAHVVGWRDALLLLGPMLSMGVLLVEVALISWHRIPFTCTYLPGKRPVAHSFLLLLLAFGLFTSGGGAFLYSALLHTTTPPVLVVSLLALAAAFRWLRLQFQHNRPLEFEDEAPEAVYGLHLNA
jgi:hypothetical protein